MQANKHVMQRRARDTGPAAPAVEPERLRQQAEELSAHCDSLIVATRQSVRGERDAGRAVAALRVGHVAVLGRGRDRGDEQQGEMDLALDGITRKFSRFSSRYSNSESRTLELDHPVDRDAKHIPVED